MSRTQGKKMSPDNSTDDVVVVGPSRVPTNSNSNERLMIFSILQGLYESEINCSISSGWDSGWAVKLGDQATGYKAEGMFVNLLDAARFLREQAIRHYPHSVFATMFVP
jgi:hypothetical protein